MKTKSPLHFELLFILFQLFASFAFAKGELLKEAERQLSGLKLSSYQHTTEVNEASGTYKYDCSGFITYTLKKITPLAYTEVKIEKKGRVRPVAQDFYNLFSQTLDSKKWIAVDQVANLQPGDLIVWLKEANSPSTNTGHIVLVKEVAQPIQNGKLKEVYVTVIDSAHSGHAADTRTQGKSGLGRGVVSLIVNDDGRAIGYRWSARSSSKIVYTSFAFGRLID